ncbi:MAG: cytochrome C [Comamonadaceae bacterium CG1_02_60_18]|nr:MAG: cytochrome C [Comamonadaceae bacterium CG1_02_60_18]
MRLTPSLMNGAVAFLLATVLNLPVFAASSTATQAPKLDNATCLSCHDGKKGAIEVPAADDEKRELLTVTAEKLAGGVHAKMECVACHTDIRDSADKANAHGKADAPKLARVDCAGCHEKLLAAAQADGTLKDKPRLEVIVKNAHAYQKSFHARPNQNFPDQPNATCDGCHDTHSFNVPADKKSPAYDQWRLQIGTTCGSTCHSEQLDTYAASVHGQAAMEKHDIKAAVCTDCHTTHAITSSSDDPFILAVTDRCGSCHEKSLTTYRATYHGQINALGYTNTAKCYSCHGSHKIAKADDPKSTVHPTNLLKTCQTCHSGKKDLALAPAGFATYQPHGHAGDFNKYPQIWVAWQIMLQLLVGTFAFFWLHTLLWFYREFKERKAHAGEQQIRLDSVPAQYKGKHVQRFSPMWRLGHITFALSLMVLTATGIPLFYPTSPWASPLMTLLGGPHTAGLIHRTSAVIFAGVFFLHLFAVAAYLVKNWNTFKFFGPNSLVPNLQDGKDMIAMFKWFFGKGPRPKFDRWTYWEKFDYWAPFWGVTIIGVSGLIMWLPNFFGAFLPGWVFNVAAIFHAEEAFLAVVFLFTVHFFNNHFRPDKFPVEVVMFTGTFSIEEFKHDHAVEYERLVASGELEKYLVDAPSPTKLALSKLLGFVLIACGLTLLTLVGIGFFTQIG